MSRALSIKLSVALAALAIGSGALQAAAKLAITGTVSLTCNTHIAGQASTTISVAPVTALSGTSTLAVTVPSVPAGLVVSPSTSQTLNATSAKSITYTVSTATGCSGFTTGTSTLTFFAGGTTDASVTVTKTLSSAMALSVSPSPATLTCNLQNGVASPPTLTVTSASLLGANQTIPVTIPTPPSGVTITPVSGTTLSSSVTSLSYTVNTASSCASITNGGTGSFNFAANGITDASETVNETVTSTTKLLLSQYTFTPTCNTATGPVSRNITVTPAIPIATGTIPVTYAITAATGTGGLTVTAPNVATLSPSVTSLTYVVSEAAGCVGVVNNGTPSVVFSASGVTDATLNTTTTLVNSTSGLAVNNAIINLNCTLASTTYTPGAAQNIALTSTATGGTPFSMDKTGLPAGVGVTPSTVSGSASATATAQNFSLQAVTGCGGAALNSSTTGSLVFKDGPGPDKTISVTLQVTGVTPLSASPNPASLTYVKGTGTPTTIPIAVSSTTSPAPFFSVITSSLPVWLTTDAVSGNTPKTLHFSTTSICDSLAPGTYSATVRLNVSNSGDLAIPVSLLITNSSPKLSVSPSNTVAFNWTMGQSVPTSIITLFSTDSPIAYSLVGSGPLAPSVSSTLSTGLAYSFGTEIPVSFNSSAFASAQPGAKLTGTMTVTWGSPASTTVITFTITVGSAQAMVSSISPASLPTTTQVGQQSFLTLSGSGFVASSDLSQKTKVGPVVNGVIVQDTNISSSVSDTSKIILTITATANDQYLDFTNGGTVVLGVCNPGGGTCNIPTSTVTFSISAGPVIQEVTSSSSYQQVSAGQTQSIAPYDMISIFGTNFCASSQPACDSTVLMPGVLNSATLVYQNWLATDAAGASQRQLTVSFCPTGTTTLASCTQAPLLFATNTQINALVPGALTASGTIDIIVSYGYGASTNMISSAPVTVDMVATDPGIFAVGADGQGSGAILDTNWNLVNSSNPAGMRSTATDSDKVQIYMTGLGVPTTTNGCMSASAYVAAVNTSSNPVLTPDGAIIQSSLLTSGKHAPCLSTMPAVSIGSVAATSVDYAGWVADSVAGLYQVNITLPGSGDGSFTDVNGNSLASITAPVQLPITVTAGSKASQTGVSVWVAPRLKLTAPTATGQVGQAWPSSNNSVVAAEGTSPYHFAVTSGVLPTGLALNATTGAISGIPAAGVAGTYNLTVTATDSAYIPVTGTSSFTLVVSGGLTVTSSVPSYTHSVVATTTTIATIAAAGGVNPYAYSWDSSFVGSVPTGMTINSATGAIAISSQTPAGTYNVVVDALDANNWTGKVSFTVTLSLAIAATPGSGLSGTGSSFTGLSTGTPFTVALAATGGSGSYTFSTPTQSGFAVSGSTLTISAPEKASAYSVQINASDNSTSVTGTLTLSISLTPVSMTVAATAGTNLAGTGTAFHGTSGGGPYTVALSTTNGPNPVYAITSQTGGGSFTLSSGTLTLGATTAGTYTVTVSSSDGGNTASLTLTVTLTNAVTPAATAGTGLTLSSGTTFTGSTADGTYVLNISATGGTGSGWTYAIVTQSSGFAISGGALTLTASTAGTYTATISATDGSSNTANITVTINLQ
jgi:hypothetical protein